MTGLSNTYLCVFKYAILRILIREVAYFKYAGITWAPLLSFLWSTWYYREGQKAGAVS